MEAHNLDFDDWEDKIITKVGELLECSRSDAQGIVDGQSFSIKQSWSKGLGPDDAAKIVVDKATVS